MLTKETLATIVDAPIAGSITIRNEAFFETRFSIEYTLDGHQFTEYSENFGSFNARTLPIPEGATSIFLKCEGLFVFAWSTVFTARFDHPVTKCYKVWGTMFSPQHEEIPC